MDTLEMRWETRSSAEIIDHVVGWYHHRLRHRACAQIYMPVRVMEHEHNEHAVHLARIRELTGDLQIPPYACATWTALYKGLALSEAELMEHTHLENNVLFPRAGGTR